MVFIQRDPFIPATLARYQRRKAWGTGAGIAAAAAAGTALSFFVFPRVSPWAEHPAGAIVQETPEARYQRLIKQHFKVQIFRVRIEEKPRGICTTDCGDSDDPFNYSGKARIVEGRDAQSRLRIFAFSDRDEPLWEAIDIGHRRIFVQRNGKGDVIVLKVAEPAMGGGGWIGQLYHGEQAIARWMRQMAMENGH